MNFSHTFFCLLVEKTQQWRTGNSIQTFLEDFEGVSKYQAVKLLEM